MGITLVLPISVHVITVLFFQGVRHSHLFTSVGRCWGFDSQRGCAQKETNFQKQSLAKRCRCGWERMKSEGRGHRRTSNFTLEVWSLAPGCQRPVSLKRRRSRSNESLFGVSTAKLLYLKSSSVSCLEQDHPPTSVSPERLQLQLAFVFQRLFQWKGWEGQNKCWNPEIVSSDSELIVH